MITLNGLTGITTPGETVSGTGVWSVGGTQLYKDASGNLGLGVTPSAWSGVGPGILELKGNAYIASTSQILSLNTNCYFNGSNWIYKTSSYANQYETYLGQHIWRTAPSGTAGNAISFTQAMTLDASGNLLVGTTSFSYNPINGVTLAGGSVGSVGIGHATGTASGNGYASFTYNGTNIGSISQNGTTGVLYITSSDQRLKTNISPAGLATQSILDFPVDQFDWISDGSHVEFGAVAQKVINVIPEMVSVPENKDEMWGIDWSKAVPRLIKTIQELHEEIQTLKAKVNA